MTKQNFFKAEQYLLVVQGAKSIILDNTYMIVYIVHGFGLGQFFPHTQQEQFSVAWMRLWILG